MKKLMYFLMAALMVLATVSCVKDNQPQQGQEEQPEEPAQEIANLLPSTVWTASWSHTEMGVAIPFKATLAFEDQLVSLVVTAMDLRVDQMPCILYGHNQYQFDKTTGQVSFSVSFLTSSVYIAIPVTTFSGTFNPESEVLTLQASNSEGTNPFGLKNLDFIKESKMTTLTNPFPATTWRASWSSKTSSDLQFSFKALLTFDSTSANMAIYLPEMKVDGIPVVMYGTAPYQFKYSSGTEGDGDASFTISTISSVYFYNLPETTFSGVYHPDSDVLTLNVSSPGNELLGKKAIDFVRD